MTRDEKTRIAVQVRLRCLELAHQRFAGCNDRIETIRPDILAVAAIYEDYVLKRPSLANADA